MDINNIVTKISGYVTCKSPYYQCRVTMDKRNVYEFNKGVNKCYEEFDSPSNGISYLISMYKFIDKKMIFPETSIEVNGESISLEELSKYAFYVETNTSELNRKSVRTLIKQGLQKSKENYTIEQIIEMFQLSHERLDCPPSKCGNERYRSLVAIGVAQGKQIFCFPWMSKKMYEYFKGHISFVEEKLTELNKIVIMPLSPLTRETGRQE